MMYKSQTLKILQYNTQKSREVMADLFTRHTIGDYDILAIQEPYRNPFQNTTYHPAKDRFHLLYFNSGDTRACMFINKRIDSGTWNIRYVTGDICVLHLSTPDEKHMRIYNVYNQPRGESETRTLETLEQELQREDPQNHVLLLGDFNLYHPQWSELRPQRPPRESHTLVNMTQNSRLWQVTPRGMKTHRSYCGDSTIDLAFATYTLREQLLHCKMAQNLDSDSDHLPISVEFNWDWKQASVRKTRQWAATDIEKLRTTVQTGIRQIQPSDLDTAQGLDRLTARVVEVLTEAIDKSTPWNNPSPRALPGFNKECKEACAETQRRRRQWQWSRHEDDWQAYKETRNAKGRLIKKHFQEVHREKVTSAASKGDGPWKIAKWAINRHSLPIASITPSLAKADGSLETLPEQKVNLLRAAFFPPPAQADLSDTLDFTYPEPHICPSITESEIERAIRKTAPRKMPGPDGITNGILQKVLDLILPTLHRLFNASWQTGYFPQHFRQSITVVLRKPGKEDYTQVKAYRPIALLNTIGKALEAVISRRLMYLADQYQLLPDTHLGGRKMASTEHAIHQLLTRIHQAWDQKYVASLLLLDVSGAFDNVSHPRLLHNLRKRKIDLTTVRWIASFLSNRVTTVVLPEFTAEECAVDTGIPQGSPLSPILYLFYNADLLEQCVSTLVSTLGYIDDVSLLATGATPQHNTQALKIAHKKAEDWARKHGSVFATSKYTLVHFTRRRRINKAHPLRLPGITITPAQSCRYLGLQMDNGLNWRDHIQHIQQKASKSLAALSALASSTWGANVATLRLVYRAMIVPRILYACSAWFTARRHRPTGQVYKSKSRTAHLLTPVQRRAAQIIMGAFRTTAANAVEVEAHLLPIDQGMERNSLHSALRMLSCPAYNPLRADPTDNGQSPLHHHARLLHKHYGIDQAQLEYRRAHVVTPWWRPPQVIIDDSAEGATTRHNHISTQDNITCLYTDGSGIDGHVGSAAIMLTTPNIPDSPILQQRTEYMGKDTEKTVYAAELQGIHLALQILHTPRETRTTKAVIFADNQSALKTIRNPGNTSGQYILAALLQLMDEVAKTTEIELRWIPAHHGIPGNEAADKTAKEAARQGTNPALTLPTRRPRHNRGRQQEPPQTTMLLTKAKHTINQALQKDWEVLWTHGRHGRTLHRLGTKPDKKTLQLHQNLPRPISSVITQMRTDKIGLAAYLHSIDKAETGRCSCNYGEQTVEHVLLKCRQWVTEREEMWGGGRRVLALKGVLSDPRMAARAAKMMLKTGLLEQFQHINAESLEASSQRQVKDS
jgi:ribonuclease HI/exonuclease III